MLDSVYDAFVARLVEATRSLKVGPAEDPAASVGPVIDEEAFERIEEYIELGRQRVAPVLAAAKSGAGRARAITSARTFSPTSTRAPHWPGGNLRPGAGGHSRRPISTKRSTSATIPTMPSPAASSAAVRAIWSGPPRNAGRQLLSQSRDHRGSRRATALRRIQALRHRHKKAGVPTIFCNSWSRSTITENTLRRGFAPPAEP